MSPAHSRPSRRRSFHLLAAQLRRLAGFADRIQAYCDSGDTFCDRGLNVSVHSTYPNRYHNDAAAFVVDRIGG